MWPGLFIVEAGVQDQEVGGGHPLEEEVRGQRLDTTEQALLQQIIMARTGERTEARHYRADPATADHQG